MGVTVEPFGTFEDPGTKKLDPVQKFVITSNSGVELSLLSYGAGICGIVVPDKNNVKKNVVLGFDKIEDYVKYSYQGSSVGRCANRIKAGKFTLNGQDYQLAQNNNGNHLHGGISGWSRRVWNPTVTARNTVVFSLISRDGDEGYPGTVMTTVQYSLVDATDGGGGASVEIFFRALTDADTVINMTNHAYFNLAGHDAGPPALAEHVAQLQCDKYLPVDDTSVPTGELKAVDGTPFDLRSGVQLGPVLRSASDTFDHHFMLQDTRRGTLRPAMKMRHPDSGRTLELLTSEPGFQLYTANYLPEEEGAMVGRGGVSYKRQGAFCCEPQNCPDAINQKNFPDAITKAGEVYRHDMVYKFSVE